MQLSTEIKDKIIKRPDSVVIRVVTNNNGIITRSPSENPTITNMVFDVQTTAPSGIDLRGNTFPTIRVAFLPQYTNCPVYIPSAATNRSFLLLLVTEWVTEHERAKGAPRPGSWITSVTMPLR
ncbi:hypothetical protein GOBAR_DD15845 [Gossypium barbadense]|nr:hypothetical protein GOBAR_DD15845 [Gossypium barbadense]